MMKKFFALFLAVMLLMTGTALAADELDLSYVKEHEDLYTIDVNSSGTTAFVETTLGTAARAFTHKYESEHRYNCTWFDILVVNYKQANTYPVFRLWITYCADNKFQNIDSVSFILGEKKYTFTDVSEPEWRTHDDQGYMEDLLIRFGEENMDFLIALEDEIDAYGGWEEASESLRVKMILHGEEDIAVRLDGGFIMDFVAMRSAVLNTNTLKYLDKVSTTDMKVSTIK